MFENLACGVLTEFDENTIEIENEINLLTKNEIYDMNCLQLAQKGECLEFMSLPSVQNLLTKHWYNEIKPIKYNTLIPVKKYTI